MVKVNTKITTKLFIPVSVLLITSLIMSVGCQEVEQVPSSPATTELSSTLVPNVPLDIYVYGKQESPTAVPLAIGGVHQDINVESLAVWGVPSDDDFTFGVGLTLTGASAASEVYAKITSERDGWKMLSGNTIYYVQGSGTAAESLKTAISNNDFKYYDDEKALNGAAAMPSGGETKLAAIAIAKPSEALINFVAKNAGAESLGMLKMILKLAGLEVLAGGLYSPNQIDIVELAKEMDAGGIQNFDLGVLILAKSGIPGFVVAPVVKKFLTESEFTETKLGEVTVYRRFWNAGDGRTIPVLVRIEGNYLFAAVSGQASYAQTLITSINR